MKGFKKDNHYVPQSYLKHWTIEGKVLAYRLLVPHEKSAVWKPHSTKSVAVLRHLYTRLSGSEASDEVERWLERDCGFHAIRTLSPRTSGHSFHAHSDRQSERSDAGSHC